MVNVPKRVAERIIAGIKRYQPILESAKTRDVGEADTGQTQVPSATPYEGKVSGWENTTRT